MDLSRSLCLLNFRPLWVELSSLPLRPCRSGPWEHQSRASQAEVAAVQGPWGRRAVPQNRAEQERMRLSRSIRGADLGTPRLAL